MVLSALPSTSFSPKTWRLSRGVAAVWTLLLVVIVIFSVQNRASLDVLFLHWTMSMPTVFLILGHTCWVCSPAGGWSS